MSNNVHLVTLKIEYNDLIDKERSSDSQNDLNKIPRQQRTYI